jgi:4-hydroxybenzoate polyprenyltransferase
LRPRQWLKNLLVFLPVLAAHSFDVPTVLYSLLALVIFSLCASSAYLLNDALDSSADRQHATKRHRPIASGALPLPVAILVSPFLALTALALSGIFNFHLFGVVSLYFAITVCYSLHFKRLMMVDIVTLSVLYTLRLLGGSAATGIVPSFWLLAFSFFIFLSLAMLKRYSELFNLHREGMEKPHGRGYIIEDKTPLGIMGIATAFISVLIFMLYFNSPNVQIMYQRPAILIFIVPLLVFWLCRLWLLAFRGEVNEDPVLFVSRDKQSLMIVAACLMLLGVAGIGEVP